MAGLDRRHGLPRHPGHAGQLLLGVAAGLAEHWRTGAASMLTVQVPCDAVQSALPTALGPRSEAGVTW